MVQFQLAGGRYKSHHHAFAIFGQIEKPLLRVLRALTSCNFTRFLLTHLSSTFEGLHLKVGAVTFQRFP